MKKLLITLLALTPFISLLTCANQLPVKAFASLPDVSNMHISPDGKNVISLVRVETPKHSGYLVSLLDIETLKSTHLIYSDNQKFVITSLKWANSDFVLVTAKFPAVRYGTPTTETRLMKLNVNTKEMSSVLSKSFLKRLTYIPNIMSQVVDVLPEDDNHILMSMAGFNSDGDEALVKVSLSRQGRTHVYQKTKNDVIDWLVDNKKRPRIAVKRDDTHYKILEKDVETRDYRTLWEFEAFSENQVWPLSFGENDDVLYVKALHQGKNAIFKVDLTDQTLTKELVFFNEDYDVSSYLRKSGSTGAVVGVGNTFFDKKYKHFQDSINAALPDTNNYIIGSSADENLYLLLSTSDVEPGMYLLGNRKEKSMKIIGYKYQSLTPDVLNEKQAITYKARDGLEIEGYLTLPKGKSEDKQTKLPAIIFPHGGPISFDDDDFDYWTQFLVSRGYAVLQMNFRGSSGYGYNFMKQGLASWGQAMQDDVEDGARRLIKEGIADEKRMCIVGASYGGYAALMGTVKTPDLYQCAVSFAGVTDVEYLVKSHRYYTNYEIVKKQIGNDYDKLWEVSPLKHAAKITKPVLLIHGSKDRVVRVHHSEEMLDELEDENKDVQYIELDGGDHYLSNNEHRLTTFKAIEAFLAEHLAE